MLNTNPAGMALFIIKSKTNMNVSLETKLYFPTKVPIPIYSDLKRKVTAVQAKSANNVHLEKNVSVKKQTIKKLTTVCTNLSMTKCMCVCKIKMQNG